MAKASARAFWIFSLSTSRFIVQTNFLPVSASMTACFDLLGGSCFM